MFQTPLAAELQLPSFLGEGFRHWRVATHHNLPWLHVTVNYDDGCGLGDCSEQWMVDNPETLESLIQDFGDDRKVFDVQVATPPWINQLGRWLIEPVESLMIGEHAKGHDVYIYRLPCGRMYYWGLAGDEDADQIATRRIVFSAPGIPIEGRH